MTPEIPMDEGYYYLLSPYTHDAPEVREERYRRACETTAGLLSRGYNVFSPIAHSHPVALCGLPITDHEFWNRINKPFIENSVGGILLMLPGWDHSAGIKWELDLFAVLDPSNPPYYLPDNWMELL